MLITLVAPIAIGGVLFAIACLLAEAQEIAARASLTPADPVKTARFLASRGAAA